MVEVLRAALGSSEVSPQDIHDRKRNRCVFIGPKDAVAQIDPISEVASGRYIEWNPKAIAKYGLDKAELVGKILDRQARPEDQVAWESSG